ncbi:MAG: response regulator [Candidatus Velamenicoccus archaeovorus]
MTAKKRILICDDEEGIRESLKLILEKDYDLVFSCSGQECLEMLKKEGNMSMVLIDIKMPKQSGINVTREIKHTHPGLPVIIVTGYKSAEIAQEATEAGASDYIVKPFETKEILKRIQAYIK